MLTGARRQRNDPEERDPDERREASSDRRPRHHGGMGFVPHPPGPVENL
jgi:hypothetical protein